MYNGETQNDYGFPIHDIDLKFSNQPGADICLKMGTARPLQFADPELMSRKFLTVEDSFCRDRKYGIYWIPMIHSSPEE